MPNVIPAPIPPATATASGVVSTGAQVLGSGVKTFSSGIIANSAATFNAALTVAKLPVVNEPSVYLPAPVSSGGYGLAGAVLWSTTNSYLHHSTTALSLYAYAVPLKLTAAFSTVEAAGGNGTGASDVGVKIGVSTADASVNASAKLLSVRTGIGGTEVEKAWFSGGGGLNITGAPSSNLTSGHQVAIGSYNINIGSGAVWLAGVTPSTTNYALAHSTSGGLGTPLGTTINAVNTAYPINFAHVGVAYAQMLLGRLDQSGTDSSGTPGAATINKPSGISAIAGGATTVTITNSLVTASSRVRIDWYGDLGTQTKQPWVTRAAGSFTVNVGTAPAGAVAFGWEVSSLI